MEEKREEKAPTTQPCEAPRTCLRVAHHEGENLLPGGMAFGVVGVEPDSLGMCYAVLRSCDSRYSLSHLDSMLCSQAVSAARQVNQRNRNAIARVRQSPICHAADSRLIHASRLSQLSLAETLCFE